MFVLWSESTHKSIRETIFNRGNRYAIGGDDTDACVSGQLDFVPIPLGRPAWQVVLFISAIWLVVLTKLQHYFALVDTMTFNTT